jgi:glucose-6-phosphate 1-dehydrogenase
MLGDALEGDPSLFARQDMVEAAWKIVEPVLDGAVPVHQYRPGTWGPRQASRLAPGGWHDPLPEVPIDDRPRFDGLPARHTQRAA